MNVAGAAPFTNVRRPPRPALAPPRPALAHAPAAATPTPWPGPSFSSTNYVLPWQAHRFARRPEYLGDLGFSKKKRSYIRLISSYQGVSGSYQPNISSKTLYQALADISLIYQADTMVVLRPRRPRHLLPPLPRGRAVPRWRRCAPPPPRRAAAPAAGCRPSAARLACTPAGERAGLWRWGAWGVGWGGRIRLRHPPPTHPPPPLTRVCVGPPPRLGRARTQRCTTRLTSASLSASSRCSMRRPTPASRTR